MERYPGVMWAGNFDEKLHQLITIFATANIEDRVELPGPYARSLFFDKHTVERLCNAVIKAEDAVICKDAGGQQSFRTTSILTGSEKTKMFGTMQSPFYGPLVGLANIAKDYVYSNNRIQVDSDAYVYQPLKKYWSQMIRRLWDLPARSLVAREMFQEERYLIPHIFCRLVEVERSFASVIEDESDLTIPLITRYWTHATGEEEIVQSSIFLLMLIPRVMDPGSPEFINLYDITADEIDTTVTILRRILRNEDTIAAFVKAITSHLQRFRDLEATIVLDILGKFWSWARAIRKDPLCSIFLKSIRTSVPLWRSLFEAMLRPANKRTTASFTHTPHFHICTLAFHLVQSRDFSTEAMALSELWVSTGVFDALEVSIGEVLRHGTEEEQVELCCHLTRIYHGISYGTDGNPSLTYLIHRQLPRPRTIRRLWDISLKLTGTGITKVSSSHAARISVVALELLCAVPNECARRGCEGMLTARCARCRSVSYCNIDCQKRDWKDHKMVCNIPMEMTLAVADEVHRLTESWMGRRR